MSVEDVERRQHWFRLARELGQEDDFRALLDEVQRDAVEQYKRSQGSGVPWSGEAADPTMIAALASVTCGFRDLTRPDMPACTSPPHPVTEPHTWPR